MKSETFDVCWDDDNIEILDWINSHFENDNWHKFFEVTITMREFDYIEEEDENGDPKRVYKD